VEGVKEDGETKSGYSKEMSKVGCLKCLHLLKIFFLELFGFHDFHDMMHFPSLLLTSSSELTRGLDSVSFRNSLRPR
jgi:hypothetical protein